MVQRTTTTGAWTTNRIVALIAGIVFTLVGILGLIFDTTGGSLFGFQVDLVHNLVHLVIGIVGLAAAYTGWPRTYNQVFGVIYIVLGILGLFSGLYFDNKFLGIIAINGADNGLHLVAGIILAAVGFFIHDYAEGRVGTARTDNDTMTTP